MAAADDELALVVELRAAIHASGLSFSEIARQAGVAQSQVSRFMSGKTITVITAGRLLDHFGMTVLRPPAPPAIPETISKRK